MQKNRKKYRSKQGSVVAIKITAAVLALVMFVFIIFAVDWIAFGNAPFTGGTDYDAMIRERDRRISELANRLIEEHDDNIILEARLADLTYAMTNSISLNNDAWYLIDLIISRGWGPYFYYIGGEKDVTLSTGEVLTFQIWGWDHDYLADGSGRAGATFGMRDLMEERMYMNQDNTNVGGWHDSAMRIYLHNEVFFTLPVELQNIIRPVVKETLAGGGSSEEPSIALELSHDRLFLFTRAEISDIDPQNGGRTYEFWKNSVDEDRVKRRANGVGSINQWWHRTPRASDSINFSLTRINGTPDNTASASAIHGICFGFAIGGAA